MRGLLATDLQHTGCPDRCHHHPLQRNNEYKNNQSIISN